MGLTKQGYKLTTSADYLDKIVTDLNIEFPHMSNASNNFAIVLSRIMAELLEESDAIRAEGYSNAYVSTAVGEHLSKAVSIAGINRRYGTRSYGKIKVTKKKDYVGIYIPPETLIESGKYKFITLNKGHIPVTTDTPVEIEIASVELGSSQNLTDRSVFKPVVNINGLDSMVCELGTFGGSDTETDAELRERYYKSMRAYKNSSLPGIIGQVLQLEDVVRCTGRENNTDRVDSNGLPPHSFQIFCEGGSNSAIANKLFDVKPAGIQTHGDVVETINFNDVNYTIKFSRYQKQDVYYSFVVKPLLGASVTQLETDLKNAIMEYTAKSSIINHPELVGFLFNNVKGIANIREIKFGINPNPQTDTEIVAPVGKNFATTTDKINIVLEGGSRL